MDASVWRRRIVCCGLLLVLPVLVGCVADICEVRMSQEIWLETERNETVVLDVRNASGLEDFPLEDDIRQELESKGYRLLPIDQRDEADLVLNVMVYYVGLERPDFTGEGALGGGFGGGAVGAGVGIAAGGGSKRVATGAVIGAAIGAGAGALQEKWSQKEIFNGIVGLRIRKKDGAMEEARIVSRVREKDLTYDKAIDRVAWMIANQIGGLF